MYQLTHRWESYGSGIIGVASVDHPLAGGGKPNAPAYVRHRIGETRPAADDMGELLPLASRRPLRELHVPAPALLWLKADTTQRAILVETA